MWNYLIDTGNVVGALGEDEADYISGDLLEYLGNLLCDIWNGWLLIAPSFFDFPDEERLFNGEAPDSTWEQFAIVATDLLERIQSSLSYANSPYASGDEEEIEGRPKAISRENFKMWLAADS